MGGAKKVKLEFEKGDRVRVREGSFANQEGEVKSITEPKDHVRAFIAHRREREAGIISCLEAGVSRVDSMVERLYVGLNPNLRRAAGRSVLAHLVDLVGRGMAINEGPLTVDATYRLSRR